MAFKLVVVGTSRGGFQALKTVLGGLPKDFTLPVVAVLSSLEDSQLFAPLLSTYVRLPVVEIDDKQKIKEGQIFVAPSDYHVLIDGLHLALSTEAPVLDERPSIDVLFESAAESFSQGVLAVLLTGISRGGTAGLKRIKECGGFSVVQDPSTAEGQVTPETAIATEVADKVLPLDTIAPLLVDLSVGQRMKA